jgi:hypothetical protein
MSTAQYQCIVCFSSHVICELGLKWTFTGACDRRTTVMIFICEQTV